MDTLDLERRYNDILSFALYPQDDKRFNLKPNNTKK